MNVSRREKALLKAPSGDQGVLEEQEKVLCINCNDFIDERQMPSHLEKCTEFIENPRNMNVKAFQELLNSLISTSPKNCNNVLESLHVQCNRVLLKQRVNLDGLLKGFDGPELVKKCILRVISFSNRVKEDRMKHLKTSIKKFQDNTSTSRDTLRLDQTLICQMREHVKSRNSFLVSTSTNVDSDYRSYEHSKQEAFYSTCLYIKQNIPMNHVSQTVPISHLFNLSVQKKIEFENWHDFILTELKDPQNYELFTKRTPKRSFNLARKRFSIL